MIRDSIVESKVPTGDTVGEGMKVSQLVYWLTDDDDDDNEDDDKDDEDDEGDDDDADDNDDDD